MQTQAVNLSLPFSKKSVKSIDILRVAFLQSMPTSLIMFLMMLLSRGISAAKPLIKASFLRVPKGGALEDEKEEDSLKNLLQNCSKAIVSIDSQVIKSLYDQEGYSTGTGFVYNKNKGLIVTNAHIASGFEKGKYYVEFFDGVKTDASLLYYDIWQDFAILQVKPSVISEDINEIKFSSNSSQFLERVFIISNSEGQSFSTYGGFVSNVFGVDGILPQEVYVVSMNIAGGASGSPVMNHDGKAIGLLCTGGDTYINAVKGSYIKDVLDAIESGKSIVRKHIGAVCKSYSLNDAALYRGFLKAVADEYSKNCPGHKNRILMVKSLIPGSPASIDLKIGDIIWEVEGEQSTSSLYNLDRKMNDSKDVIKLKVYRYNALQRCSELKEIEVSTYDVNEFKIKQAIDFCGALIFPADDRGSFLCGVKKGDLIVSQIRKDSSLACFEDLSSDSKCQFKFQGVNGIKIATVDQLKDLCQEDLHNKTHFTVEYSDVGDRDYGSSKKVSGLCWSRDVALTSPEDLYKVLSFDNQELGLKGVGEEKADAET
jgi:S1-C subfamily serine protease